MSLCPPLPSPLGSPHCIKNEFTNMQIRSSNYLLKIFQRLPAWSNSQILYWRYKTQAPVSSVPPCLHSSLTGLLSALLCLQHPSLLLLCFEPTCPIRPPLHLAKPDSSFTFQFKHHTQGGFYRHHWGECRYSHPQHLLTALPYTPHYNVIITFLRSVFPSTL